MINTKKIAENREIEALKNLAYFGFLTTKSIGNLTEGVSSDTAIKSAKRVLKRLLAKKEVLKRKSLDGVNCFVLSEKGAKRVKPLCFRKTAKTGAELQTRYAGRQDRIVDELIKIRQSLGGIPLGEIWLKRDTKRIFVGLHGLLWNVEKNVGVGVYFIASTRVETALNVVRIERNTKTYLKEIKLISADITAEKVIKRHIEKIKKSMPLPPINL